jgi:hypothetical protein
MIRKKMLQAKNNGALIQDTIINDHAARMFTTSRPQLKHCKNRLEQSNAEKQQINEQHNPGSKPPFQAKQPQDGSGNG